MIIIEKGFTMEWITSATDNLVTLFGSCVDIITENPLLAMCFTGSCLIPLGLRLFRKFRRA